MRLLLVNGGGGECGLDESLWPRLRFLCLLPGPLLGCLESRWQHAHKTFAQASLFMGS